jgi:hypothetical protein
MMQDIATALYCAWILSRPESVLSDELPYQDLHGPLEEAVKAGAFAPWADRLYFVDASVGRVCAQLPEIRGAGYFACFTHTMGRETVLKLLRRINLEEAEVTRWGTLLRTSLHQRARQTF